MFRKAGRYFTAFLFSIFFLADVCAQNGYRVDHFTTENGLPSNGIKGLQWDAATGFLWIATEAGLVRYNGMNFTTFDVNTNPDLGSSRIVFVLKNTKGKIFVGGEKGNLLRVEENRLITEIRGESTARFNYNYYSAVTASDTLLRQCLKTPWDIHKYSIHVTTVVPLNDTACLALSLGSLYYYSVSTKQPELIAAAPHDIKSVFSVGDNVYYLSATGKVFLFDVHSSESTEELLTDNYGKRFVMKLQNSKLFWQVGMDNAVIVQDGNAWVIEKANKGTGSAIKVRIVASGIDKNTFFNYAQYINKGNYLFLGSESKGFFIIHSTQLVTKKQDLENINSSNAYYSQIELPDGNILTNKGTIIGDSKLHSNFNISSQFANSVYQASDSTLIYSTHDSVYYYNRKTLERKLMFSTFIDGSCSFAFTGGHLYFGNQSGVGIVNENGTMNFIKRFDDRGKPGMSMLFNMIEMEPGKLALANCEGLMQFDIKTKAVDTLLKLPSVCIRALHKEGDYIFIGTYGGGFFVMKNGVLKPMPQDINGYLKYTHCFIKDNEGYYWISTNRGLFKVKLTDIIDAYEKNLPQIYYHYLGKEDGMLTTEMNGGCEPCAIKLKNNNFSFPTMDGLLQFNPAEVNIALPSGKIFIDKVTADGKEIAFNNSKSLQLSGDIKKLDLSLAINAWCKKENIYIDYKVNSDKWIKADISSGEPEISLANLSFGSYKLQLRKLNGFGTNSYSYLETVFTIATPFYQQWWFRILALIMLACIGYLIFKYRLRQYAARQKKLESLIEQKTMDLNLKNSQLEKNNTIKMRLISIINHDIITPLKFMHYAGKALVENKDLISPEDQAETISEITQTAKGMEMLSSQILDWIIYQNHNWRMQKEEFNLHQLVEMIFGVLRFSARQKNIRLQNRVPVNFVVFQYREPMRVMIYNLVLNSLNFTVDGNISVSCSEDEAMLVLQVKDSGIGITSEQIDNLLSDEKIIASVNVDQKKGTGLGYLIIKDLLQMMDGSLNISSIKNQGTTVYVSFPFR